MSKYLVIGDPHLTSKSMESMEILCSFVENKQLPTIWLGDMLDTKEIIRGKCQNFWLDYFKNSKLQHHVLVGNHDYFNLDCKDHSLQYLKSLDNVTIVDSPLKFDNILMLPYIHEESKLKEAITKGRTGDVLFGHLELKGFDFGNGFMCEHGLSSKSFTKFGKVISGHFHKFQEKGNLTYLGTPFSHSFGESNQIKYVGVIDTDTLELSLEELDLPKHVTIEIDVNTKSYIPEMNTRDSYRIILTGNAYKIDAFPTDRLLNQANKSIKLITRPDQEFKNEVALADTDSNEAQFTKWAKDMKGLDQDTLELGLEIMEEARVK